MSEKPMSEEDIINWQPKPEESEELPPARNVVAEKTSEAAQAAQLTGKAAEKSRKERKYGVKPDGTIEPEPGGGSTIYRHVNKPKA